MSAVTDDPRRPKVGVGVVVFRGDSVLSVQRGRPPNQGEWSIPGGHQEWGETLFEAAAREVQEETGLIVRPVAVITAVDIIHREPDGTVPYHFTIVDVLADWVSGDPVPADDAADALWSPVAAIDQRIGWEVTRRVIRQGWKLRHPEHPLPADPNS